MKATFYYSTAQPSVGNFNTYRIKWDIANAKLFYNLWLGLYFIRSLEFSLSKIIKHCTLFNIEFSHYTVL